MAIQELAVEGYRSIRKMSLKLGPVNVLTGPNGCGKSNLYQSVFLLAKAASGGLGRAIAEEGGMPSVLWAGVRKRMTRRAPPVRVILSILAGDYGYELQIGLPQTGQPPASQFMLDPEVKVERIWPVASPRVSLMVRDHGSASIRDAEGRMVSYPLSLYSSESLLSQVQEPHAYPELSAVRGEMRRWRFYHHFRTDPDAALRQPQVGVLTPVLDHSGADLAAALETILEIGDREALGQAVDRAFPGSKLEIASDRGRFSIRLRLPGILRPLESPELSDGTLRYLCLVAALLSPRPPAMMALNEPETSIHPDLVEPLAKLIADASQRSQMWITTHSPALARQIEEFSGQRRLSLRMVEGETLLEDHRAR